MFRLCICILVEEDQEDPDVEVDEATALELSWACWVSSFKIYQISKYVRLSVLYHFFSWEKSSPSKKLQQTTEIITTACTFNHVKFGLSFWDVLPSVLVSYRNCTVQSFVHDLAETRVKFTRWHGAFCGAHHGVNVFIELLGSKHCKSILSLSTTCP